MKEINDPNVSRRQMLGGVAGAGLLATGAGRQQRTAAITAQRPPVPAAGTPEQIHLQWGEDPATAVTVSWGSPGAAERPRLLLKGQNGRREVRAIERMYTDGLNGETVWTYHAVIEGLRPATTYSYAVTADNDSRAQPFSASFTTAPQGRAAFRFSSFGDLATPNTQWVLSYGQAAYAVAAVESFKPLFHLLNGDLCYANLNPMHQPEVWRDFGKNNQASAASRPWMPCSGNHEIEFNNGPQGFGSYLNRYHLPDNSVAGFRGHWYKFQVGSALFISLDADDVTYQDSGPFVSGPASLVPDPDTGNPPIAPGTSFYVRGYSGGAQTAWLRQTLADARQSDRIDWIVVQMHQCPATSALKGNGCDLGIRQEWLPLFDEFQVDLVVCGHDHNYERSFPVRGYDPMAGTDIATGTPVETRRPHPVTTTDSGVFDTTAGTVYMVLGTGGTNAVSDQYDMDPADGLPRAHVFTKPNRPVSASPGTYFRAVADAHEDATWSAKLDSQTGYGVTVFDVDPGSGPGGHTSITVSYYHAPGADPVNATTGAVGSPQPAYTLFDTFKLVRPRSDGRSRRAANTSAPVPQPTGTVAGRD
jgi:hypothetical protein